MEARIADRCRFRDCSKPWSRLDSHSDRLLSPVNEGSNGCAGRLIGGFSPEVYSAELADAVEGTNTALAATAVVFSLERLKRGLKVDALIPHLYTMRCLVRLPRGPNVDACFSPTSFGGCK